MLWQQIYVLLSCTSGALDNTNIFYRRPVLWQVQLTSPKYHLRFDLQYWPGPQTTTV